MACVAVVPSLDVVGQTYVVASNAEHYNPLRRIAQSLGSFHATTRFVSVALSLYVS